MVTTRRALLGAGAVALLAGCGPAAEPKVDAGAVLNEQLRLSLATVQSYDAVPGTGSLRSNAEARVRRLNAALEQLPGKPVRTQPAAGAGLEPALAAESAALRGYVAAVGQLKDRDHRELLAGLVADAAANQSALLVLLKRPPAATAFPGQPIA